MTTSLSRKETIAALEPVKAAVATRSAIQELSHIWFDGAHVSATNGGLGIKAKFSSPLKCGVPGALFFGLLNQAATDMLEFKQDGNGLKFKAGRSSVTLNTLPLEQFPWRYPDKPKAKPTASLKISAEFLIGLKRVSALKVSGPRRMEHYAVCIFAVDDEMDLYTTDSKSMLVMPVKEKLAGSVKKIALPRELADQIITQCKPGQTLNMYPDHFSVAATDKVQLYSNIFDTSEMLDLPSFADNLINEKKFPSADLPTDLHAVLERAMVLAGSEEPLVLFKSDGKVLKLSARFKYGEIAEEFAVLSKGLLKTTLSLNAKTVLSIKDVKKVSLSERAAAFLGDDDFSYVLAAQDSATKEAKEEEVEETEEASGRLRRQPTPPPASRGKGKTPPRVQERRSDMPTEEVDDDIPF
jgi:DNA polymerase III sliding clamp (beta) subunit (PCNA family)